MKQKLKLHLDEVVLVLDGRHPTVYLKTGSAHEPRIRFDTDAEAREFLTHYELTYTEINLMRGTNKVVAYEA